MDEVTDGTLTQRDRIEEAHGVWELAVARVAAMAEVMSAVNAQAVRDRTTVNMGCSALMDEAMVSERRAFSDWQKMMQYELGLTGPFAIVK